VVGRFRLVSEDREFVGVSVEEALLVLESRAVDGGGVGKGGHTNARSPWLGDGRKEELRPGEDVQQDDDTNGEVAQRLAERHADWHRCRPLLERLSSWLCLSPDPGPGWRARAGT